MSETLFTVFWCIHFDCESVWLTFDTDGRLINPVFKQMQNEAPDKAHFFAGAFTKTQYAGPQTHIVIVRLLQYIFRKYCTDVRVLDEGNYWDTNDLAVLQERFSAYTNLFNAAFAALQQMPPAPPGESVEDWCGGSRRRCVSWMSGVVRISSVTVIHFHPARSSSPRRCLMTRRTHAG